MNPLLKLVSVLLACVTAAVAAWLFGLAAYIFARMIEPSLIFASYLIVFGMVTIFFVVYDKAVVYWRAKLGQTVDCPKTNTDGKNI